MDFINIHTIVPTDNVDIEVQHTPYTVAGIVPITEGMSYRDLQQAMDDELDTCVDDELIHSLVRELMWEDPRADVKWGSDVYALGPYDNTYSIIITGEF